MSDSFLVKSDKRKSYKSARKPKRHLCGGEVWRGGLGGAYLLPTLSSPVPH